MGGRAQGVHVVGPVQLADAGNILANIRGGIAPHVAQVHHQALTGVVAHDALGALKDDIGAAAGGDGRGELLVAVLIVDGGDGDLDVGVDLVESGDQGIPVGGLGEAADVEGPQADLSGAAGGGAR